MKVRETFMSLFVIATVYLMEQKQVKRMKTNKKKKRNKKHRVSQLRTLPKQKINYL